MSSLNVGGATSARWAEKDWPTSSRNDAVERADSIQRIVDDQRSLGPLATGTARYTNPSAALTQQDFEVATRLGPNGVTVKSPDQMVSAPKADRNPWNAVADRKSVNGYDHIRESLRTAALKRDAAPAGSSSSTAARSATSDEYGEAYVRNAIAAYARNSS